MTRTDPAKSARRVLFVLNDGRFFVTHRLALAVGIRNAGYEVHVAAPDSRSTNAILAAGLIFHPVRIEAQGTNPVTDALAIRELVALYRRVAPHVVHHVTVKPVLYGTLAARIARVPAVVNAVAGLGTLFAGTGKFAGISRRVIRGAYAAIVRHRNMHFIFQNTEDLKAFQQARLVGKSSVALIPGSGVDLHAIRPHAANDDVPLVTLVARLLRQKGIEEFVAAARVLKNEGIPARFALVGDAAANRDAVPPHLVEAWRAEQVVELWGWRDDMQEVLAQSSIACLPSYYGEGVPKSLIDAAAAGLPIVTTDMPGCRDTVIEGVNGFLVPPRDAMALANALRTLLEDPARRRRFGVESRRLAEERFSIQSVIDRTLAVYRAALEAR